jgi:hypothetical protein
MIDENYGEVSVKDMLEKKRKLNLEVAALLETFYRETGMSIRDIYVESEEANWLGTTQSRLIHPKVSCKLYTPNDLNGKI